MVLKSMVKLYGGFPNFFFSQTTKNIGTALDHSNKTNSPSSADVTDFPLQCLFHLPCFPTLQLLLAETLNLERYWNDYFLTDPLIKSTQNQTWTEVLQGLCVVVWVW